MRGFPSILATKADVLYCLPRFPEETKAWLKQAFEARKTFFPISELPSKEAGKEDATHTVDEQITIEEVLNEETGETEPVEKKTYIQMELLDNPCSAFFRMGFTEAEYHKLVK